MRTLLLLLCLLPILVNAASVDCYSGNRRIYHGKGSRPYITDQYLGFYERSSHKEVVVMADCIIKMSENEITNSAEN